MGETFGKGRYAFVVRGDVPDVVLQHRGRWARVQWAVAHEAELCGVMSERWPASADMRLTLAGLIAEAPAQIGTAGLIAHRGNRRRELLTPQLSRQRGRPRAVQLEIDEELVGRLLASQFSRFAGLPIRRVATGTVNAVFRAGDDLAVRLPLSPAIQDWDVDCALGALAGRLPLDVPAVLGTGEPDYGYPLKWSLHTWIDGEQWRFDRVEDPVGAAVTLAEFLTALQAIDPTTLPCPPLLAGHVNPLRTADVDTRAPAALSTNFDSDVARRLWDEAAHAPGWDAPPRLIHWDLLRGNVLIRRGRLAGVIDWGALTAADPARDLIAAWTLFRGESRAAFRATAPGDDAAWARARGWAMTLGARTISKVLADPL